MDSSSWNFKRNLKIWSPDYGLCIHSQNLFLETPFVQTSRVPVTTGGLIYLTLTPFHSFIFYDSGVKEAYAPASI